MKKYTLISPQLPTEGILSQGATEVMDLLIDNGANLAAIDNMKRSPLECAVRYNRVNAVKKLLENHVNVNSQNVHGGAALHQVSIPFLHKKMINKLFSLGGFDWMKNI